MQPIIGKIEQLTERPCPPTGGSGVSSNSKISVPILLDTTALDEVQRSINKIQKNLLDIQHFIGNANISFELTSENSQTDELKKQLINACKKGIIKIIIDLD